MRSRLRDLSRFLILATSAPMLVAYAQAIPATDSVVSYLRIPPGIDHRVTYLSHISVDSIKVLSPSNIDSPPIPIGGLDSICHAIAYPFYTGCGATVVVQATVTKEGYINLPKIRNSFGPFYSEANQGLCLVHFEPARHHNLPIESVIQLTVHFSMTVFREFVRTPPVSVSRITLQAYPGLVSGPPDFTSTIDSSGGATYEGRAGVELVGPFVGACSKQNFKQLEAILRDFCFFGSFFGFGDNSKIAVACYKITVVSYGKETVHWSTEADCLWGLAMTIEGLRQQIHWYKAP